VSTPASEPWISVGRAPDHAPDPPDISAIQDICEIEGHAFVAMELLLGQTLASHRRQAVQAGLVFQLGNPDSQFCLRIQCYGDAHPPCAT